MSGAGKKNGGCETGKKIPPEQGGIRHGLTWRKPVVMRAFKNEKRGMGLNA